MIQGLVDEDAFARILRRERDRADRTLDDFALVAADLGTCVNDRGWCRRFERVLASRMRSTDEAGWLAPLRVGIALPHTDEAGAWTFVHALKARLDPDDAREAPRFTVYQYSGGGSSKDHQRADEPSGGTGDSGDSKRLSIERAHSLESLLIEPPGSTKRVMDLALASGGLVLASPVLALAALAIKLSSRGPVLFRQERAGFAAVPFTLLKLRTMVEDAEILKEALASQNEADGPVFKMARDPRVTAVGRFLRKSSIDELPQLWNVLRGDMSIVGPRPPTLDEIEHYTPWQRRRLHGMGGLTCLWQVKGRSEVGFLDWMRLDLRYLRRRSLPFDLVLVLRTIPAVLTGRGAK